MAPELFQGEPKINYFAADVWAWACVVEEILTCKQPFDTFLTAALQATLTAHPEKLPVPVLPDDCSDKAGWLYLLTQARQLDVSRRATLAELSAIVDELFQRKSPAGLQTVVQQTGVAHQAMVQGAMASIEAKCSTAPPNSAVSERCNVQLAELTKELAELTKTLKTTKVTAVPVGPPSWERAAVRPLPSHVSVNIHNSQASASTTPEAIQLAMDRLKLQEQQMLLNIQQATAERGQREAQDRADRLEAQRKAEARREAEDDRLRDERRAKQLEEQRESDRRRKAEERERERRLQEEEDRRRRGEEDRRRRQQQEDDDRRRREWEDDREDDSFDDSEEDSFEEDASDGQCTGLTKKGKGPRCKNAAKSCPHH